MHEISAPSPPLTQPRRPALIGQSGSLVSLGLGLLAAALAFVALDIVPHDALIWRRVMFTGAIAVFLLLLWAAYRQNRRQEVERQFATIFADAEGQFFLTDALGKIIARNAAACPGTAPCVTLLECVEDLIDAPATEIYRMARQARMNGGAQLNARHSRIEVWRMQGGYFVWRVMAGAADGEVGQLKRLPVLHRAPDGTFTAANARARLLFGCGSLTDADIVLDPPMRSDAIHRMCGKDAGTARVVLLPNADGGGDVILLPHARSEVGEALPDHVLDEFPVALVRLLPNGEVLYANQAAQLLLGNQLLPGTEISSLMEGLGRSIRERLSETMSGRAHTKAEVARGRVNDHEVYLQVTLNRVEKGGEPSILMILSDATELKTLEAQFVQSQKMQAVGQLAGGVAHDFNNLLTAIHGHCDLLLLRHDAGDNDHGDLMQIRQNGNRAAALVSQLLAFSRKQTLRPRLIRLDATLAELAHLLNRLLGKKVRLQIDSADDLWPVRVDERQFEQVIVNLVLNARDAMPEGGEVKVTSRNLTLDEMKICERAKIPKGEYVIVEVEDSGTGIPPDKINKIFEPFFTTKRVGEGTGLGLSTAYGIVKQTGGFIFADSTPGKGTIFTVYLPVHDTKEEVVPEAVPPKASRVQQKDLSGRGTVLLVEDEAPVRSFAARALRLRGYTVLEADSGEAALEILADHKTPIDLFLSDVIMPGMDGPTWVREARHLMPHVPTIFMSGYAEEAFRDGKSNIADSSFLAKPFSLVELTERVKMTISPAQTEPQSVS